MRGAITGKDVLLNSVRIVRLWGLGTYLACLRAALSRKPSTFLGVVCQRSFATSPAPEIHE